MGYLTRTPTSNDKPPEDTGNRWLEENECFDETALLLSGGAKRCRHCHRAISIRHLEDGTCPDCRGTGKGTR